MLHTTYILGFFFFWSTGLETKVLPQIGQYEITWKLLHCMQTNMENMLPQALTYDLCLNPLLRLVTKIIFLWSKTKLLDLKCSDEEYSKEKMGDKVTSGGNIVERTKSVLTRFLCDHDVDNPIRSDNTSIKSKDPGFVYLAQDIAFRLRNTGDGLDSAYGNNLHLILIKGDIFHLRNTDSIVNFVYDEDIYGKMGIMQAAGDAVKEEYNRTRLQKDHSHVRDGVVKTTAGNLPYKAIFHVRVFEQSAKFKHAIYRMFQLADRLGIRSIAFPALASRKHVDNYLEILYEFEKRARPTCLHMIDIVANNQKGL